MFEVKPDPRLEGWLGPAQRRAYPSQLVADDDLLRWNAEDAQAIADHLQGQTGTVLAGGVEHYRQVGAPDHLAQNGQLGFV